MLEFTADSNLCLLFDRIRRWFRLGHFNKVCSIKTILQPLLKDLQVQRYRCSLCLRSQSSSRWSFPPTLLCRSNISHQRFLRRQFCYQSFCWWKNANCFVFYRTTTLLLSRETQLHSRHIRNYYICYSYDYLNSLQKSKAPRALSDNYDTHISSARNATLSFR